MIRNCWGFFATGSKTDASAITDIDFSAARTLRDLLAELTSRKIEVVFGRVNPSLRADMERHGIGESSGEGGIPIAPRGGCLRAWACGGSIVFAAGILARVRAGDGVAFLLAIDVASATSASPSRIPSAPATKACQRFGPFFKPGADADRRPEAANHLGDPRFVEVRAAATPQLYALAALAGEDAVAFMLDAAGGCRGAWGSLGSLPA